MTKKKTFGSPDYPDSRKEQFLEKPLPSSEDSERVILGAVLLNNHVLGEVAATLTAEDFYSPLNRRVFAAMLALRRAEKEIDPILVGEELKKEGSLESIGGTSVITNLTFGLPHFTSVAEYIKVVHNKSILRRAIRVFNARTSESLAEEDSADTILSATIAELTHLRGSGEAQSHSLIEVVSNVRETFDAWKAGNDNVSSLRTGIPEVDGYLKLKGLAKGELSLIGARPSTGKTALLLQIATNVVRCGVPTLFISLEMLKEKLVMRMLPPIAQIPNKAINPYTLKQQPQEAEKLYDALAVIEKLPMYFDRSFTLDKLVSTAEFFIQNRGVELVVFDYLTLIKAGVISRRQDTRDAEVGNVTNELKELAIRRNVAVLGAAQMNRASEKEGGKPRMSGFRESGVIEQAVDVALFPHDPDEKEHAKNPDSIKDGLWLDLLCGKQRDGARGWSVPVYFDKNMQTLESQEMKPRARATRRLSTGPSLIEQAEAEIKRSRQEPEERDDDLPDFM